LLAVASVTVALLGEETSTRSDWVSALLTLLAALSSVIHFARLRTAEKRTASEDAADRAKLASAQQSLRDAEARFVAFMDHCPFPAWMRAPADRQLVYCNDRFARDFGQADGMKASAMIGSTSAAGWMPLDVRERWRREDEVVIQRKRASEFIEHLTMRDGSVRHWLILKFPVPAQSSSALIGGVALDLTARFEAEEKLKISEKRLRAKEQAEMLAREAAAHAASRLKSQFLAHMSHGIRTPISGVIGMTELLLGTALGSEQHSYADGIRRSAESLHAIINDILDFSKIEAGRIELERIGFRMADIFEDVEKTMVYQAREKGLRLGFEPLSEEVAGSWLGDPQRIKQVLANLVSNAIKFTGQGCVRVRVSLDAPGKLRCEVADSGIGIPPGVTARLFEPFSQADSSTSRKFGGTGLGLSICKSLVEKMGGTIGVESTEGQGSRFWFTLPLVPLEPGQAPRRVEDLKAPARPMVRARLLVAEDNPINQKILLKQLEKLGIRADAVANGQDLLAALEDFPYDMILMDCQMPGMDGYEATARVRASSTAYRSIPIVAVTASAIQGDREKCLALGMNDYVSKPVHPDELGRVLTKWLARN
jgi:signal transduction histidine kinase/CheY-like chemotaxis protein